LIVVDLNSVGSRTFYLANVIAQYLETPLIHSDLIRTDVSTRNIKSKIGNCEVYFPSQSFVELVESLNLRGLFIFSTSNALVRELENLRRIVKVFYIVSENPVGSRGFGERLLVMKKSDAVIALDKKSADCLRKVFKLKKVIIVPPAIDYTKLRSVRVFPRGNTFIVVGGACRKVLGDIFVSVKRLDPSTELIVYTRRELGEIARLLDMNISSIYGNHMDFLYKIATSKGMLSLYRGWCPIFELEAMALGVPVVEVTGFGILERLFKDYDHYRKVAEESRDEIEKFDVYEISKKYLELVGDSNEG